jgi:hypothetical protein
MPLVQGNAGDIFYVVFLFLFFGVGGEGLLLD